MSSSVIYLRKCPKYLVVKGVNIRSHEDIYECSPTSSEIARIFETFCDSIFDCPKQADAIVHLGRKKPIYKLCRHAIAADLISSSHQRVVRSSRYCSALQYNINSH
jgi:hypothetical protein